MTIDNPKRIPTYQEALDLVDKYECFYKKTEEIDKDCSLTSFTYRLASYSEFCNPCSLNMRGITFNSDTEELVGLPFHKFFNYGENPFTEPNIVNSWDIYSVNEKLDGSLVYFVNANGNLCAKTKFNCFSSMALCAEDIILGDNNSTNFIWDHLNAGLTPMFEYVGPDNQVVIPYTTSKLVYLGSRNMKTGNYISFIDDSSELPEIFNTPTISTEFTSISEITSYCQTSEKMEEGFVLHFTNGEMVKIKTRKYVDLHHTLSSILNEKNLASLILNDELDDLLPLLDNGYHNQIFEFKDVLLSNYNHIIHMASEYFEDNKHLSNKDYALRAMDKFGSGTNYFSVSMSLKNNSFNEDKFKVRYINNKTWENQDK
jgi:T4 RnlA family RNA ligase